MTKPVLSSADIQRHSFLEGEGDRWFARNDFEGIAQHTRYALEHVQRFIAPGFRILEIGCGDGRNLAFLSGQVGGLNCHGVEPSEAAVKAATQRYPELSVSVGSADRLDFDDLHFDLVCFGFCLYLVDRQLLLRSLAEADRVLKNRGFLVIIDFDPVTARRRAYRHLEGIYSYKMQYADIYLSTGHYQMASKISYSHGGNEFDTDPAERVSTVILHKDMYSAYANEEDVAK